VVAVILGAVTVLRSVVLTTIASMLLVSCGNDEDARPRTACDLLTSEQVAAAIGVAAREGQLTRAIGEDTDRICEFSVDGPLMAVTVYLGEGAAPSAQTFTAGLAIDAKHGVFVRVGAQHPDADFAPMAQALADRAIKRAARP
jgi:hypothetical protein